MPPKRCVLNLGGGGGEGSWSLPIYQKNEFLDALRPGLKSRSGPINVFQDLDSAASRWSSHLEHWDLIWGNPNREQSESLTETEDLDLGSHSERGSRRRRAEKPCPWGQSAALALARSLDRCSSSNSSLCTCTQEEICTPLSLASRGSCRCGFKQTHSPSPALLTHAFCPKGYRRKLCNSCFLRFPRRFMSSSSLFLFLGKLGKGV